MKYIKTQEEKERLNNFANHIFNFYGKNSGLYGHFFNDELTLNTIKKYLPIFLKKVNNFEFDSFDREFYRDYLFVKLGYIPLENIEYKNLIKDILSKKELKESELLYKTKQYNL